MTNATPPTPAGILDDARSALHNDIADAVTQAELNHLGWADVADLWHLSDIDRGTDNLAAIHLLIERALGI